MAGLSARTCSQPVLPHNGPSCYSLLLLLPLVVVVVCVHKCRLYVKAKPLLCSWMTPTDL